MHIHSENLENGGTHVKQGYRSRFKQTTDTDGRPEIAREQQESTILKSWKAYAGVDKAATGMSGSRSAGASVSADTLAAFRMH